MTVTRTDVETALLDAFSPEALQVRDDSHLHAGHAGAREGGHFHVHIVSDHFNQMSRLKRHRLVYDALRPLMARGIHALAIDARAPGD